MTRKRKLDTLDADTQKVLRFIVAECLKVQYPELPKTFRSLGASSFDAVVDSVINLIETGYFTIETCKRKGETGYRLLPSCFVDEDWGDE